MRTTHKTGPAAVLAVAVALAATLDPAVAHGPDALPLGDGNVSAKPERNHVFACQTKFRRAGVSKNEPWIEGDVWYPGQKAIVDGHVEWDAASISIEMRGDQRLVVSNGLPDHSTGRFPIDRSSTAYRYDRNPNSIAEQNILLRLPAEPKEAPQASCVPMGMIGIALTGVAIFNALDVAGLDAAAHEVQDACNGHPERRSMYHYHNLSPCMADPQGAAGRHSSLIGYALDGFGIYGPKGESGETLVNADLDACHGHSHAVEWNGEVREIYHYHATAEYPYTIGCFTGSPVRLRR